MSESGENEQKDQAWAPFDLTDGKEKGQWKSCYPPEARKWIRIETCYLLLLTLLSMAGIFYILTQPYIVLEPSPKNDSTASETVHASCAVLGIIEALLAGTIGGCCFGIKCMYHFVAKQMWHEDRRLWRLLSPPLSGILSVFMAFLVASGLMQIFDKQFLECHLRVIAFSFLVGYFSDKALAKMADVADTVFGSGRSSRKEFVAGAK